MKRILSLTLSLGLMLALVTSSALARPANDVEHTSMMHVDDIQVNIVDNVNSRDDTLFLFASSGPASFGSPGTDSRGFTFDDLGGGQCTTAGWVGLDKTTQTGDFWHLASTAINAGAVTDMSAAGQPWTIGDPDNDFAIWCGRLDVCGWADTNGYGNNWNQHLRMSSVDFMTDLEINFAFNHNYEGDVWDFFQLFVEVDDGVEIVLEEIMRNDDNANNSEYHDYSFTVLATDYPEAEEFGDVIMRFSSDGAWSDEDGLQLSDFGAVWVDNLELIADGSLLWHDDFESGVVPPQVSFASPPGAGDYSALYTNLYSQDICSINTTCAWAFFDLNTENPEYPIPVVAYGQPNAAYVDNDIWSPILDMAHEVGNPVGTPVVVDATTQVWMHFWTYWDLPQNALIYASWSVASETAEMGCVGVARNDNTVYYGDDKQWGLFGWGANFNNPGINVTQYVAESAMGNTITGIAMGLNCVDMCPFWCDVNGDGTGHTPAPYFDNARLQLITGSAISWDISGFDRFQDSFPDAETGFVRIDSSNDVGPIGGAVQIADSTMIELNMDLDGGIKEEFNVVAGEMRPALYLWYHVIAGPHMGMIAQAQADPDGADGIWSPWAGTEDFDGETYGKMQASQAYTNGQPIAGKFAFDFHEEYFSAGDIIEFFYRAESNGGTIETRPGWAMSSNPDLRSGYRVRCLPTAGTTMLLCDDHIGVRTWWEEAFRYNGYTLFDIYSTQAPSSGLSNGLAGRADWGDGDLDQYSVIVWDSGSLPAYTITNGDIDPDDKTDDTALLHEFLANNSQDSYLWVLGDLVANDLGNAEGFLTQDLGVNLLSASQYYDDYTGILVPKVFATHSALEYLGSDPYFWVDGGCPSIENFSVVEPNGAVPLSVTSHDWEVPAGTAVAGIYNSDPDGDGNDTSSTGHTNRTLFMPYSYYQSWDAGYGLPAGKDYVRLMVGHVLNNLFNHLADTAPDGVENAGYVNKLVGNYPNPFNPKTTIRFSTAQTGNVNLAVYDISGRLVKELVNGSMSAGDHEIVWSGKNGNGNQVASGVYFYKMVTADFSSTEKMVMLK